MTLLSLLSFCCGTYFSFKSQLIVSLSRLSLLDCEYSLETRPMGGILPFFYLSLYSLTFEWRYVCVTWYDKMIREPPLLNKQVSQDWIPTYWKLGIPDMEPWGHRPGSCLQEQQVLSVYLI